MSDSDFGQAVTRTTRDPSSGLADMSSASGGAKTCVSGSVGNKGDIEATPCPALVKVRRDFTYSGFGYVIPAARVNVARVLSGGIRTRHRPAFSHGSLSTVGGLNDTEPHWPS